MATPSATADCTHTQIADVGLRRFMAPACNVATNVIIVKCLVTCSSSAAGQATEGVLLGQAKAKGPRWVTLVDCLLCCGATSSSNKSHS